uniref:Bm10676, isoform d n=2 Tax=Brugia malayi TaxID=6279 RepID=A0A1I9G3Y0_BRUMA|nr:Bm10676, isoform d [Brugia malayi]
MDCSELWCLASVDGGECKEAFDTYDDFEEHFCRKHLDLALFACGAKGCTAQFGTVLQIFRHLAICKRRGKKIKLLQYSDDVLESLTALDRAKLLAMHCSVKRAKQANQLAEINGNITAEQAVESNVQCSFDGMNSSLDDDQIHISIIESPKIYVEDVELGPKERAVTPARQAAWRLKEQMLLEEQQKKNKPPEKVDGDTQKKQKKLPVKITDKTRISALINDNPKKAKRTSSHLQTMESGVSRNPVLGTMNSNMCFESTKHIVYTERRPKLLLDKNQDSISTIQKQPRIFESSLPAGPNNPSKIPGLSRLQPSFDVNSSRPPDYSDFLRNPVINPTLHEISLPLPPILALESSSVQPSDGRQSNVGNNHTFTKTALVTQPNSEINVQQKLGYRKSPGILRTKFVQKKHGLQNEVETVEYTGQMDLNVLSLFSKRLKECKVLDHLEMSTTQTKELQQAARKHSERSEMKSSVRLEGEEITVELTKFKNNTNLISLSSDKDCGGKEDEKYGETIPVLLNLFSNNGTAEPVMFDPRIMPKSHISDKSRNDRRNSEGKVVQEKKMEIYSGCNNCYDSSGSEKKR